MGHNGCKCVQRFPRHFICSLRISFDIVGIMRFILLNDWKWVIIGINE